MGRKILVIQTAFIGDAILASSMLEAIHRAEPDATIDFLVRRGNEVLFSEHPFLNNVFVWDKKGSKYKSLFILLGIIRAERYDVCINLQRFGATGFLTAFSGARTKIGFSKNPFSFLFSHAITHDISAGLHETQRNCRLLEPLYGNIPAPRPRLYPAESVRNSVKAYQQVRYICMAPTSVWFTKQWPAEKWSELCSLHPDTRIYLLGAPADRAGCQQIIVSSAHPDIHNLCGELSLPASACLMAGAAMNYVNDSAPMHLCSAMNAPVTAVFCSTVPRFGFGPLSDAARVVEIGYDLYCRPCGLHGYQNCPEGHFRCAREISPEKVKAQQ